jgi:hypothetical protein
MEYKGKINKANSMYIPMEIKNLLGEDIIFITAGSCVLMIPSNLSNNLQLESVEILKKEIQLKQKKDEKNNTLFDY